MVQHSDIRNPIISGLNDYMKDVQFVQSNQTSDQLPYPFGTYTINNPYIPLGHNYIEQMTIEDELIEQHIEHFEQVYSFTIVGTEEDQVMDLTMKAIQFFKVIGVEQLKEKEISIVEVYNPQNRDNFLSIEYERRMGFDVRIRVAHSIENKQKSIDALNIN